MASDNREGEEQPPAVGGRDRAPELARIADLAEQREHRDERAHRHEEVRRVHPVELLQRGLVDAGGRGDQGAQLAQSMFELPCGCAA